MMVKICGITCPEDARAAVEAGASALGFNFYGPSPRSITPETAARLARLVPADRRTGTRLVARRAFTVTGSTISP